MSKNLANKDSLRNAPNDVDTTATALANNELRALARPHDNQDSRSPPATSRDSRVDAVVALCLHKGNSQNTTTAQIPATTTHNEGAQQQVVHHHDHHHHHQQQQQLQQQPGKPVTRSRGAETRPGVRAYVKHCSNKRVKKSVSPSSMQVLTASTSVAPSARQYLPLSAAKHGGTGGIDHGVASTLSHILVGKEGVTSKKRRGGCAGSAKIDLSRSIEQGPGEGLFVRTSGCSLDMACPDQLFEADALPPSEYQDHGTIHVTSIAHEATFSSSSNNNATDNTTNRTNNSSNTSSSGRRCSKRDRVTGQTISPAGLASKGKHTHKGKTAMSEASAPAPAEHTTLTAGKPAAVGGGAVTAQAEDHVQRATAANMWEEAAEEAGVASSPSRSRSGLLLEEGPFWGNVGYAECVARLEADTRVELCTAHSHLYQKTNMRSATEQGYHVARERLTKFHNARLVLEGMLEDTSLASKAVKETFEIKETLTRKWNRKGVRIPNAQENTRMATTEVKEAECALNEEEATMTMARTSNDVPGGGVVGWCPFLPSRKEAAGARVKKGQVAAALAASSVDAEAIGRFDLVSSLQHAELRNQAAGVRYNELKARAERYKKKETTARDIALGAKQRWCRATEEHVAAKVRLQCAHRVWTEAVQRRFHAREVMEAVCPRKTDTFLVALAGDPGKYASSGAGRNGHDGGDDEATAAAQGMARRGAGPVAVAASGETARFGDKTAQVASHSEAAEPTTVCLSSPDEK